MSLTSKELLQKGVAEFRAGNYESSIELFSAAIAKSGGTQVIYESRSAAYERMGKIGEALKDARKVIELAPASPQGYLRSAKLFLSISRPSSASKMLDLASARISVDDTKRREKLAQLREETQAIQIQKTCHVSKLPYEILSEIMLSCVQNGGMKATRMSAVCSHWRSAALATPDLWRVVRLGHKHPEKLLKLYTTRSGSSPDRQAVLSLQLPSYPPHTFELLMADWMSSPRFKDDSTLVTNLSADEVSWSIFNKILKTCRMLDNLESLSLRLTSSHDNRLPDSESAVLDHRTPFRNLHDLDLNGVVILNVRTCPLRSLRRLRLTHFMPHSPVASGYLDDFLRQNSQIRDLELGMKHTPRVSDAICILECLERLCLDGPSIWRELMERLVTPKLTTIELSRSSQDVCGLLVYRWTQSGFPPLVNLRLNKCGVGYDARSLVNLLESLPTLERLKVNHCGDNLDRAIARLAASSTTICPRLQYVDLSNCPKVRGVSIRDLVKSRMSQPSLSATTSFDSEIFPSPPPSTTSSILPPVLLIQTLIVDNCPNIPADLLPWLRKNVPRFSCVYEAKVQAKDRRPRQ